MVMVVVVVVVVVVFVIETVELETKLREGREMCVSCLRVVCECVCAKVWNS